jgi:hypothetical protein
VSSHGIVTYIVMRSVWQYLILLAAVSFSALANPTPSDPEILIDIGCCSLSLSNDFNSATPDGTTPTLAFDFKNDTGLIVTSLTFNTKINAGLSDAEVHSGFGCPAQGYFLSCVIFYDMGNGALQYNFSGVNAADGDENYPIDHDTENGQQEGIPIGGDFKVTLQGWTVDANTAPLYATLPTFDNGFTVTPEPSQLLLLAVECLVLVSIAGIIRRRTKRKENRPTA